jgi:hypothetical protein
MVLGRIFIHTVYRIRNFKTLLRVVVVFTKCHERTIMKGQRHTSVGLKREQVHNHVRRDL